MTTAQSSSPAMSMAMDLDLENKVLQKVAEGGSMDYALWPEFLTGLIRRLEQIVYDDFPPATGSGPSTTKLLSSPPTTALVAGSHSESENVSSGLGAGSSHSTDKENAPPSSRHPGLSDMNASRATLPPQITPLLRSIIQTLTTYFSQYPPHTIQRLSELILAPRNHYRTLVSYLHAVDRVVHVTSGANIYPLPAAVQDSKALPNGTSRGNDPTSITWGASTHAIPSLGSDESLGGALLTPISWLCSQNLSSASTRNGSHSAKDLGPEVKTESTETIDGPNGAGSVETVSVSVNGIPSTISFSATDVENSGGLRAEGGVTQGELLRQEQRAGVVPATQLAQARNGGEADRSMKEEDETPHARGPEEIGMEDMGPQVAGSVSIGMQGIDVEAAVGRRAEAHDDSKAAVSPTSTTPKREAEEEMESTTKRLKDEDFATDRQQVADEGLKFVNVNDEKAVGRKPNEYGDRMDTEDGNSA